MKIRYITSHGIAEWVEFNEGDRDTLIFSFTPQHAGALLIGGKILPLCEGEVEIPISSLRDGEYSPRLESDSGVYAVESFTKHGKSITLKDDGSLARRLLKRCYGLETELADLRARTKKLEISCNGHQIFDFERKEK